MKINRTYIVLILIVVALVAADYFTPKEVDWVETYAARDKVPYGTYVLTESLKDIFPGEDIDRPDRGFYVFAGGQADEQANYIMISNVIEADDLDIRHMTGYAAAGNNIFIAASEIPQLLADTLGISISSDVHVLPGDTGEYLLNFTSDSVRRRGGYSFRHENIQYEIADADTSTRNSISMDETGQIVMRKRSVLGESSAGDPTFVRIPFGKGAFYIHCFPRAFTNYNMLRGNNSEYVSKCLSFLPVQRTHWDEYYKPFRRNKADTPLRYIISVPSYAWAFYIALSAIFIYMLFASKRLQRIIPTITPPANLSLEFTRTIGTLYYHQRNHRDIAVKKMIYLLEKVRQQYFLQTADTGDDFRKKVSYKSDVSIGTINAIFDIYEREIRRVRYIDEATLIQFNTALEKFYKESGLTNK